jgi:hypothetical protein
VEKNSSNYGRIYVEILNGFTSKVINKNNYYFKHPSLAEHFTIYNSYELLVKECKQKGLLTEKEKIEEAITEGWWSSAKESEILMLKKTIANLNKTRSKLVLPSQKKSIDIQIKKNEAVLATFLRERGEITNLTAEQYANQKFIDEMAVLLTYKDKNLSDRYFTDDDFYNLPDSDYEKIKEHFNENVSMFNNYNIKCVASSGFFQNLVYLNDDAYSFWGKPTVNCTKYQIDLLVYGKMYKNLIKSYQEGGESVPDDVLDDPEKFILWTENLNNKSGQQQTKSKKMDKFSKNRVSSFVGATEDDLKQMGVKTEKIKGKSLLDLAEASGGVLEKHDYLKARESS